MMFERYAVFYTPTGPLADFGAGWLGWDSARASAVPHPDAGRLDVAAITQTPRKYGLHATLKAPFRMADDVTSNDLLQAAADFASREQPFDIGPLALQHDHGFVALRPLNAPPALGDFATRVVTAFDNFRAPLTAADIARRRQSALTPRQDRQMLDWGYPYIFADFHFHMTLSGPLTAHQGEEVIGYLAPHLAALIDAPFHIDAITVMGQDQAGMFHQIHRYALTG